MSDAFGDPYSTAVPPQPAAPKGAKPSLWRRRWFQTSAVGVVALVVGVGLGAGVPADATDTPEYQDIAARYEQSQSALAQAQDESSQLEDRVAGYEEREQEVAEREDDVTEQEAALEEREAALKEREAGLDERERAVTGAEDEKAANTITEGTWAVGADVAPGTYRVDGEVTSGMCYWEISRAGSNGDIIDNDIVTGGRPTVTLAEGQEFKTSDCGSWVKQ